jgi:hypothetical protein
MLSSLSKGRLMVNPSLEGEHAEEDRALDCGHCDSCRRFRGDISFPERGAGATNLFVNRLHTDWDWDVQFN